MVHYRYGFHKINKSPRGQRTTAENQIWEFSHPKFLKDRPDLLESIRRKSVEAEAKKESKNRFGGSSANDNIQSHMAVMQITYSEMAKQLTCLQDKFTLILRELAETKDRQDEQQICLKKMTEFLQQNDECNSLFFFLSFFLKNRDTCIHIL
jgi:heat shock transcription factor 4